MYHCTYCTYFFKAPADQCPKCFCTKPLRHVCRFFEGCPVCFAKRNTKYVFNCGHSVCTNCISSIVDTCPICLHTITSRTWFTNNVIKLDIKPEIRPELAKLYRRAEKLHIGKNHYDLLMLIYEYYRWLLLKAGTDTELVPADSIEAIWQLHILDTVSYQFVCKELAGTYIDHDVTIRHIDDRIALFQDTVKYYQKIFGPMSELTQGYWMIDRCRADGRFTTHLYVSTMTSKQFMIPFYNGMTVADIKDRICDSEGIPPVQQKIYHKSNPLVNGTVGDNEIIGGDKLMLYLNLRGC